MATIAELKVKIGANVTDFDKKLSKVQNKMVSVGKKMQSVGKQMAMSITAPLALIGGAAIKMGSDFDKSLTQINTLVGISKDKIVGSLFIEDEKLKFKGDVDASTKTFLEYLTELFNKQEK